MFSPTECRFAPPGEYVKDHTLIHHDDWWHLFSISGTAGYFWGYPGNEETFSWSISRDLVNWEFRGHVLHASQRQDYFDQHEVWAPFCLPAAAGFYMFYAGGRFPVRPAEYRKLGTSREILAQIKCAGLMLGVARSRDLTSWEKISDPFKGIAVPGRDPHVVRDEPNERWLLYTTENGELVSESRNLLDWHCLGTCARFAPLEPDRNCGETVNGLRPFGCDVMESMTVRRHPLTNRWIMLGNWQYAVADDPVNFLESQGVYYNLEFQGKVHDLGFAAETIQWNGKWYRSGVFGPVDHWRLGFTEIEWEPAGAFRIVRPSVLAGPPGSGGAGGIFKK
jgi:hypothetical protein